MSVFDKTLVSTDINWVDDPTENTKLQITKSFINYVRYYEKYKHNLIRTSKSEFLYNSMAKYMDEIAYSYVPYNKYTWKGPYSNIKGYRVRFLDDVDNGKGIEIDFQDYCGQHGLKLWIDE